MELLKSFRFTSVSKPVPQPTGTNPLGPLSILPGKWIGHGFNQIWRPFHGGTTGQDRFLELNETIETLEFDEIPGDIPNRGLLQGDINVHGVRYLQQIQDAHVLGPNGQLAGIHVEPGIWLSVPLTSNPNDPTTVARMANIPHGTSLVAQGSTLPAISGPPQIDPVSIAPFTIGAAPPANTSVTPSAFPERDLSQPSEFRTPSADIPHVTQQMVDNPNTLLTVALAGMTIISTITLKISTTPLNPPTTGGGTANIAFLQGAAGGPNAQAAQMDASFWIETFQGPDGQFKHQLQYSQRVLLNFNKLSWPHVSVATLIKQ